MQTEKVCRYERIILPPREWLLREDGGYGKTAEVENLLTEGLRQTEKKVMFDACCKKNSFRENYSVLDYEMLYSRVS